MKRVIVFFVFLGFYSCAGPDSSHPKDELLRHVGDIPFDSQIDDPNFKPCQEDLVLVHYNFSDPDLYEGEKPALIQPFEELHLPLIKGVDGYITIRFMVNCEGETGRFRVEQLDFEYKKKEFNSELVDALLSITKSLDGWIPARYDEREFDYYKYLTFKINDNQIKDILP